MLGERIVDEGSIEGAGGEVRGLGLLPCTTRFAATKVTRRVEAAPLPSLLTGGGELPLPTLPTLPGYEIHMGEVERLQGASPLWRIGDRLEGCQDARGVVAGTLLHGVLDSDALRHAMLRGLATRRGLSDLPYARISADDAYDRVAAAIAEHLDVDVLAHFAGL